MFIWLDGDMMRSMACRFKKWLMGDAQGDAQASHALGDDGASKKDADTTGGGATQFVSTNTIPVGTEIRPPLAQSPPMIGPTAGPRVRVLTGPRTGPNKDVAFSDEGRKPGAETEPTLHKGGGASGGVLMPLPKGGLSCPNKRWYDSIYNGGVYTEIAIPGIEEEDMKRLWRKDYRSVGYDGQFAWGDDRGPRAIDEGRPWSDLYKAPASPDCAKLWRGSYV